MSIAGSLGALNVTIVDVQAPVQALCESVRPYPSHPGNLGLPAAGHAPKETSTEPPYPVDIFSIIAEIQRSIGRLSERTASVPEVYTYYAPARPEVPRPVYAFPTDKTEPAERGGIPDTLVGLRERHAGADDKPPEQKEPAAVHTVGPSSSVSGLDQEVRQSGLAIEQLKGDIVGVARDLAGVEAAIEEIVRLSVAGAIDVTPPPGIEALPRGIMPGASAAEASHIAHGTPDRPGPAVKDRFPAEQADTSKAKPARIPGPAEFTRGIALGASLSKALWGSTLKPASLPMDELTAPGASMPVVPGRDQVPAPPLSPTAPLMARASPIVRTIETYNTIVNVVKASEAVEGILPTRGATKAEITRYLLAMPGQPADDRQLKALVDLAATLQANPQPATQAAAPLDLPAGTSLPDDIPELWVAVRALQDAYATLQGNVPGPADLVSLQKAAEAVPASAAVPAGEAMTPRLNLAIEGVKTTGASIDLPDLMPVADQFREMQTMMARLQVPMYGEGGTVNEPTLALIAETGPEVIVPGRDFTAQIASLNNNYASLWTDVIVLRDGIREIVAGVNDALSSVGGGGDEGPLSMDKGYDQMGLDFFQQIADKWLTGHGSASLSELEELFKSSTAAGFFKGATGMAMSGLVGVYGMNALEEKLFDEGKKEEKSGAGGGEGGEGDAEDKEEEEFWDLMDKIDTINTIRNKRQGKFE